MSSFSNPSFAFSSHFDPGECAAPPRPGPAAADMMLPGARFLFCMEINPFPTQRGEDWLGQDPCGPEVGWAGLGLTPRRPGARLGGRGGAPSLALWAALAPGHGGRRPALAPGVPRRGGRTG